MERVEKEWTRRGAVILTKKRGGVPREWAKLVSGNYAPWPSETTEFVTEKEVRGRNRPGTEWTLRKKKKLINAIQYGL